MRSDQAAQGLIQLCLENLQIWKLYSFSGQPVPLLDYTHGKRVVFLTLGLNLSYFDFYLLFLILNMHSYKKSGSIFSMKSLEIIEGWS